MSTIIVRLPIAVEVEFDYQPPEPAETGPEAQYPGCAEAAEINRVYVGTQDITDDLTPPELADLETRILEARR